MANLSTQVLALLLLTTGAFTCDLDYKCNEGNYVIQNPNSTRYRNVQGYYGNGTECPSSAEIDATTLLVCECGMTNIKVDLLEDDGTVGESCTLSCDEGQRSQQGYSMPLNFVLHSQVVLRSGSADFYCHSTGVIFVRNPRSELYSHSVAYNGQDLCDSRHILDNQVIEVSGCDTTNGVVLVTGHNINMKYLIQRKADLFLLDCGVLTPPVDNGAFNGMDYNCYEDGTVVAVNPRQELFCYAYAEQSGKQCTTLYLKDYEKIIISDCDVTSFIFLVLSKIPIDATVIIRPNNVFLIQCEM